MCEKKGSLMCFRVYFGAFLPAGVARITRRPRVCAMRVHTRIFDKSETEGEIFKTRRIVMPLAVVVATAGADDRAVPEGAARAQAASCTPPGDLRGWLPSPQLTNHRQAKGQWRPAHNLHRCPGGRIPRENRAQDAKSPAPHVRGGANV